MNGFSKKKVGTLTLGEKLKKLRSDRRISLSEVARYTNIQIKYLEYIEEGDYDSLPADVYVKGFLKGYADFLGVDEKILIKIFEKEKGIKQNITRKNEKSRPLFQPVNIKFFSITPKRVLTFVSLFSVLLIIFFLYREVGSFANNPKLVILNPESEWETQESSVQLEGVTEKDAKVFINGQPTLVYDKGDFKERLTLQEGLNDIEVKSINRFDKETKKSIKVIYNKPVEEEIAEEIKQAVEDSLKLEVRVDPGPVWLEIESDGNLVFNGTMLSGAVQIFEAENEFKISSGRARATWIKFNDKETEQLSTEEGSLKNVIFKKEENN